MDERGGGSPAAAPAGPQPDPEPQPEAGVISSVRKGFGFIATPSRSRDVFFHVSALEDCSPEQLQEGTTVTFVPRWDSDAGAGPALEGGKASSSGAAGGVAGAAASAGAGGAGGRGRRLLATRVRLAPVGTRVRMTRVEPGLVLGFVSDPAPPARATATGAAAGATATSAGSGPKGIIRFLGEAGSPDHVFYSAEDVDVDVGGAAAEATSEAIAAEAAATAARAGGAGVRPGAAGEATAARATGAQQPDGPGAVPMPAPAPALPRGQLVLFRLCTDLRAAAQAAEQAAAAAARAQQQQQPSQQQPQSHRGGVLPGPRRAAYQRAVEVRPAGEVEVAAHPGWRQQAAVLQLLAGAVQAAHEVKAAGMTPLQPKPKPA